MTPTVPSLLTNRYLVFIGWTLLAVLWETAAAAVALAAFRMWTKGCRPARDYVAALIALFACFAIGAVMLLVLTWEAAAPAPSPPSTFPGSGVFSSVP